MTFRIKLLKVISILVLIVPHQLCAQQLDHAQGDILIQLQNKNDLHLIKKDFQFFNQKNTQLTIEKELVAPLNIWKISFDFTSIDESLFLEKIKRHPSILNAQFNHLVELRSTIPNDPDFPNQWQYLNDGTNGAIANADIDADLAWDITTGGISANGDTIVICIIDAGVDYDHEDLAGSFWINHHEIPNDGIDNDNNGFTDDYRGWNSFSENDNISNNDDHGTAVAGIIGAKGNNNLGVTGVNWNSKLMIVVGGSGLESEVLTSYSYPLQHRIKYNQSNGTEGAFVVATNASWGVDQGQADDFPLWCALYDTLGHHGILNVAATANDNWNVEIEGDMPTTCPSDFLIGVTNTNSSDLKHSDAAYGDISIDLGAPGALTWSTQLNNTYGLFAGTSAAAPQVTGAIGLLYAAPCSNIPALALNDPKAAALQVKDFILNGVDPNNDLQGITFTGGRLNVFNSLQMLLDSCGICPAPSSLTASNILETSTVLTWINNDSTNAVNLRFRELTNPDWILINDVESPFLLENLNPCTDYEVQVESVCSTEQSGFIYSHFFTTDNCCELPSEFFATAITDTSTLINWSGVLAANSYNLEIIALNPPDPIPPLNINIPAPATNFSLANLTHCLEYQVSIQVVCDTGSTVYSSPVFFQTDGCGSCPDLPYCSIGGNADLEWIAQVSLNTLNNETGSDNGYGDYTNDLSTELVVDSTYTIAISPGYANSNFLEYFRAWIDFNQDGDFDETDEMIFSTPDDMNVPVSGVVMIPNNALTGSTRMRVLMRWSGNGISDPSPCEDIDFGEIEDYCVTISDGNELPCAAPLLMDTIQTSLNAISLIWENPMTSYESFLVEYRKVGTSDWNAYESSALEQLISDLEKCSSYEFKIKTICNSNSESDFSDMFIFNTRCDVKIENLDKSISNVNIFPNPFNENIFITFTLKEHKKIGFEVLSSTGKSIFNFSEEKNAGAQTVEVIGLKNLGAGIYFIKIKTEEDVLIKKILKL